MERSLDRHSVTYCTAMIYTISNDAGIPHTKAGCQQNNYEKDNYDICFRRNALGNLQRMRSHFTALLVSTLDFLCGGIRERTPSQRKSGFDSAANSKSVY